MNIPFEIVSHIDKEHETIFVVNVHFKTESRQLRIAIPNVVLTINSSVTVIGIKDEFRPIIVEIENGEIVNILKPLIIAMTGSKRFVAKSSCIERRK